MGEIDNVCKINKYWAINLKKYKNKWCLCRYVTYYKENKQNVNENKNESGEKKSYLLLWNQINQKWLKCEKGIGIFYYLSQWRRGKIWS